MVLSTIPTLYRYYSGWSSFRWWNHFIPTTRYYRIPTVRTNSKHYSLSSFHSLECLFSPFEPPQSPLHPSQPLISPLQSPIQLSEPSSPFPLHRHATNISFPLSWMNPGIFLSVPEHVGLILNTDGVQTFNSSTLQKLMCEIHNFNVFSAQNFISQKAFFVECTLKVLWYLQWNMWLLYKLIFLKLLFIQLLLTVHKNII